MLHIQLYHLINLQIFAFRVIDDHTDTTDETQNTSTKTYLEKSSTTTNSSECTSYASSSSADLGPSSSQNEFQSIAGTSRMEYGLTTFLDYNEQRKISLHLFYNLAEFSEFSVFRTTEPFSILRKKYAIFQIFSRNFTVFATLCKYLYEFLHFFSRFYHIFLSISCKIRFV